MDQWPKYKTPTIKYLEDNIGEKSRCDSGFDGGLLDIIPKVQMTKQINWTSSELKTCVSKDIMKKKER